MRPSRRFSQAISEGDGISLLALVDDAHEARSAEADGAEGVVVRGEVAGLREATALPVLWHGPIEHASEGDVDACVLPVEGLEDENGRLESLHGDAVGRGLDPVVRVRDEDELQLALDRLDPEIFLLTAGGGSDGEALERVLGLLPDVPAGKLAVAELEVGTPGDVAELERAGIDAVIVRGTDVARVLAHHPPGH